MIDQVRRNILATGAAAAAVAAAPNVFAQAASPPPPGTAYAFFERGPVRIRYVDTGGSGYPLMLIAGGGMNSSISSLNNPFDAIAAFKGDYRVIAADLRNSNRGELSGPLEIDRAWDSYTDDHLALMGHLGINKFLVMGFCIGGPFIWNLLKRAPDRVVAAVPAMPVGHRPESPTVMYDSSMGDWAPNFVKRRPEITMDTVEKFLTKMWRTNPDFVYTVSRDFVKNCQTPVLIMPDDIPAHPYAVAWECVKLAPKAETSVYPWRNPPELIPIAVRQMHSFLKAHRPTSI